MEHAEQIKLFDEYLRQEHEQERLEIENSKTVILDHSKIAMFNPDLADCILEQPEEAIKCAELALDGWISGSMAFLSKVSIDSIDTIDKLDILDNSFHFPEYINDIRDKILYAIIVDKQPTLSKIAKLLDISIDRVSKYIHRKNSTKGLVDRNLCLPPCLVDSVYLLKPTKEGIDYIDKLGLDYANRISSPLRSYGYHPNCKIRFCNLPKSQIKYIGDIRSADINRLFTFTVRVRQASDIRPQVTSSRFECPVCGNIIAILQLDQRFKEPSRCGCGRKGKFRLLSKELIDCQGLVLEEIEHNAQYHQSKRINALVKNKLVNHSASVGDPVEVIGIIKEVPITGRDGGKLTRLDLMIEVNNLIPSKIVDVKISKVEIADFKAFAQHPTLVHELVKRFAPSVKGNFDFKCASMLQIVSDPGNVHKRLCIYLCGLWGWAKTTLAKKACEYTYKSMYCQATNSTKNGLTASVVKDEFLNGWALESGAVVLAGDGILFVDELDKLARENQESDGLSDAMSEGVINVSKANITSQSLRAVAKILACGNIDPNVDLNFSVLDSKALNLSQRMIDRFDAIFLAEKIDSSQIVSAMCEQFEGTQNDAESDEYLKKYLYYCMIQKVEPRFSSQHQEMGKALLQHLQNNDQRANVSPRVISSFNRLALASCKLRLGQTIENRDSILAGHLILKSFKDRNIISQGLDLFSFEWGDL